MEVLVLAGYRAQKDDELSLAPGDLVRQVCKGPVQGWLRGELRGHCGLFPECLVQEIPETLRGVGDAPRPRCARPIPGRPYKSPGPQRWCKVNFSYSPEQADELKLQAGEIVEVIKEALVTHTSLQSALIPRDLPRPQRIRAGGKESLKAEEESSQITLFSPTPAPIKELKKMMPKTAFPTVKKLVTAPTGPSKAKPSWTPSGDGQKRPSRNSRPALTGSSGSFLSGGPGHPGRRRSKIQASQQRSAANQGEEQSSLTKAPHVNKTLTLDKAPCPEETPSLDKAPGPEETPSLDKAPGQEKTPSLDKAPGPEETPSLDKAPGPEETLSQDKAPSPEETLTPDKKEADRHLGGAEEREGETPVAGGSGEAEDSGVPDPGLHPRADADALRVGPGGTTAGPGARSGSGHPHPCTRGLWETQESKLCRVRVPRRPGLCGAGAGPAGPGHFGKRKKVNSAVYACRAGLVCAGPGRGLRDRGGAGAPGPPHSWQLLPGTSANMWLPLPFPRPARLFLSTGWRGKGGVGVSPSDASPALEKWPSGGAQEGSELCQRPGFQNPAVCARGGAGRAGSRALDPSQLAPLSAQDPGTHLGSKLIPQSISDTWLHWG
nr:SH3 domain-containing protein 21 isoform X7 [Vicugna pacos]